MYLVPSTWYRYLLPSTWYQVLGTKYLVQVLVRCCVFDARGAYWMRIHCLLVLTVPYLIKGLPKSRFYILIFWRFALICGCKTRTRFRWRIHLLSFGFVNSYTFLIADPSALIWICQQLHVFDSGSVCFCNSYTLLMADPSEGAADPSQFVNSYTFLKSTVVRIRLTDPRIRLDLKTVVQLWWLFDVTPCRLYNKGGDLGNRCFEKMSCCRLLCNRRRAICDNWKMSSWHQKPGFWECAHCWLFCFSCWVSTKKKH